MRTACSLIFWSADFGSVKTIHGAGRSETFRNGTDTLVCPCGKPPGATDEDIRPAFQSSLSYTQDMVHNTSRVSMPRIGHGTHRQTTTIRKRVRAVRVQSPSRCTHCGRKREVIQNHVRHDLVLINCRLSSRSRAFFRGAKGDVSGSCFGPYSDALHW